MEPTHSCANGAKLVFLGSMYCNKNTQITNVTENAATYRTYLYEMYVS